MSTSGDYLTTIELKELTGKVHLSKQSAWLNRHDWPYAVDSNGRILVLREYWKSRMMGTTRPHATMHATRSHNFNVVR
jgi:hypothetical protein